jgi:hypothetical protein
MISSTGAVVRKEQRGGGASIDPAGIRNPQRQQKEIATASAKMTPHRHIDKIATRQRFCHGVFTRPRPTADSAADTGLKR